MFAGILGNEPEHGSISLYIHIYAFVDLYLYLSWIDISSSSLALALTKCLGNNLYRCLELTGLNDSIVCWADFCTQHQVLCVH